MEESKIELVQRVAIAFSGALIAGDFAAAHAMLADADREAVSPEILKQYFSEMISYFTGPAQVFDELHVDTSMPNLGTADIGWAYVSIVDDGGDIEAVSFVACEENGNIRVRDIEWGRP